MITLAIDEKDKHVLRVSASYLLALAGDITASVHAGDAVVSRTETVTVGDVSRTETTVFSAAELAESEALAVHTPTIADFPAMPDPAKIFAPGAAAGTTTPLPSAGAPSTAGAGALPIAPVDTAATISTPSVSVPVPPAPITAPAAPTAAAPAPTPVPGVELDTRGLPWDARIHSRTRSRLANGNWKNTRGTDPAYITQVENELRAAMAAPAPLAPAATVAAPPTVPVPVAPADTGAPTVSPSKDPFVEFMTRVATASVAGHVTQAEVTEAVRSVGIESLPGLHNRPDLLPTVAAAVEARIAANLAARGGAVS